MAEVITRPAMGWLPDYPDFRDYTIEHAGVSSKHRRYGQKESIKSKTSCWPGSRPCWQPGCPPCSALRSISLSGRLKKQGESLFRVREKKTGGHAVAAVGYDDKITIKNASPGSEKTVGAFLIRNSWGTAGAKRILLAAYEYVLRGLAVDWWSLLKNEWVNTGAFKL